MANRDTKAVTDRVRSFFEQVENEGLPINETAVRLAELVGCTRQSVYRWKNGRGSVLIHLAERVDQSLDELSAELGFS